MSELSFAEWMNRVDTAVSNMAFLSVYDLPDQPFRDWHEAGYSPNEAAMETLENAGYPMEAFDA